MPCWRAMARLTRFDWTASAFAESAEGLAYIPEDSRHPARRDRSPAAAPVGPHLGAANRATGGPDRDPDIAATAATKQAAEYTARQRTP